MSGSLSIFECVSTIRDECSGVDSETSAESKQETAKADDIVSANGDIRQKRVGPTCPPITKKAD